MFNKASKYLYCFYQWQDNDFKNAFLEIVKEQSPKLFIGDLINDPENLNKNYIYLAINENKISNKTLLTVFRLNKNYIKDYKIKNYIILVIDPGEYYKQIVNNFVNSKYSKMYSKNEISKNFYNSEIYYLKLNNKITDYDFIKNLSSLGEEYKNIYLSAYHVLSNSIVLKDILSKIYKVDPDLIEELEDSNHENDYINIKLLT